MEEKRRNWDREETILAMDLYCRTPFNKISKSNSEIILLAGKLKRTPSAVSKKMFNLAHYDPDLAARNVTALAHTSKLDQIIFEEFYQDMQELSYQAGIIKESLDIKETNTEIEKIKKEVMEIIPSGGYRERETKVRIGQYYFRKSVLTSYGNKCCITGLAIPALLVASHIKPWAVSNDKTEKTNPANALCLNPFHDKAFDRGFITINEKYEIVVSSRLEKTNMDENTKTWFTSYKGKQITLPDKFNPSKEFIEYHNDMIFIP